MVDQKTTPLRERMIEDMRIKGLGESSQKAHIRAVRYLAEFISRSPDTATAEDLRAYQLHMVNTNVTSSTYNARLVGLRFFFETTCQKPEMKQCLHFRTEPRRLPVVLSIKEVFELLKVAPGPGQKYRAALSISYGTGLRASEVCNLKVTDIDSDRMLIHVERGQFGAQHPFHELDLQLFHQPGIAEQILRALHTLQQFVQDFFRDGHSCFLSVKHGPDQSYTEDRTLSRAPNVTISTSRITRAKTDTAPNVRHLRRATGWQRVQKTCCQLSTSK